MRSTYTPTDSMNDTQPWFAKHGPFPRRGRRARKEGAALEKEIRTDKARERLAAEKGSTSVKRG